MMTSISRKCIITNEVKPIGEMIRVVKTKNNEYLVNSDAQGRGAYFTKTNEAFDVLKKRRLLNRSFKTVVPNDVYDQIEKELNKED